MSSKDIFNKANKLHRECYRVLSSLRDDDDARTIEAIRKEVLDGIDSLFCCVEDLYECTDQFENTILDLEETVSQISQKADARGVLNTKTDSQNIQIKTSNTLHLDVVVENGCVALGLNFLGYSAVDDSYFFEIVDEKKWIFFKLKYDF